MSDIERIAGEMQERADFPAGDDRDVPVPRALLRGWAHGLREAYRLHVACPDCGGSGRRWYSFIGERSCERCKGSGTR